MTDALGMTPSGSQELREELAMHVVTRTYMGKGATELGALLSSRKADIEKLMGAVPGFVRYDLVQTADGCLSITACKDKAGTDRSNEVARDWLKANASQLGLAKPVVSEGKAIVSIRAKAPAAAH
jgi:hypothetical protein